MLLVYSILKYSPRISIITLKIESIATIGHHHHQAHLIYPKHNNYLLPPGRIREGQPAQNKPVIFIKENIKKR